MLPVNEVSYKSINVKNKNLYIHIYMNIWIYKPNSFANDIQISVVIGRVLKLMMKEN